MGIFWGLSMKNWANRRLLTGNKLRWWVFLERKDFLIRGRKNLVSGTCMELPWSIGLWFISWKKLLFWTRISRVNNYRYRKGRRSLSLWKWWRRLGRSLRKGNSKKFNNKINSSRVNISCSWFRSCGTIWETGSLCWCRSISPRLWSRFRFKSLNNNNRKYSCNNSSRKNLVVLVPISRNWWGKSLVFPR